MDKETAQYIVDNFSFQLPIDERMAITYLESAFKTPGFKPLDIYENVIKKLDWLDAREGYLQVLVRGYDDFTLRFAKHIAETVENINYNNCPKCGKLARTHHAKQCHHCFHTWHDK